jgi:hypothetical protein
MTRVETASKVGFNFDNTPNLPRADGIDAMRLFLNRIRINEPKDHGGFIDALESYHYEKDERRQVYTENPVHDWSSHGADAGRYLALVWDFNIDQPLLSSSGQNKKIRVINHRGEVVRRRAKMRA